MRHTLRDKKKISQAQPEKSNNRKEYEANPQGGEKVKPELLVS